MMPNPSLTLTDLVDVILKSGIPKATKVKQIKHRPDYHPAKDYYKILRESIIDNHRKAQTKQQLSAIATVGVHNNKINNYKDAITGYVKWWGNKQFVWFDPPRTTYSANGTDVVVNPELGLQWNGNKHIIKLYLKDEDLSKNRAKLILNLMEATRATNNLNNVTMGLLDVRDAKLHTSDSLDPFAKAALDAELAYIATIWPTL